MLRIYLARHGQDLDNQSGILNGRRDEPLTEKGLEQAHETAQRIKDLGLTFDSVYSSPLQRAFRTAEIIAAATGAPAPEKEDLLIERDFGIMTGKKVADIAALCAPDIITTDTVTYFLAPEGAETFPEVRERAGRLLEKLTHAHTVGSVLLVCHGDIGKMLYAKYYDLDWQAVLTQFHFGNCELLLLAADSPVDSPHVFTVEQHNH
jgi:broad specificity phosphatase PhoE